MLTLENAIVNSPYLLFQSKSPKLQNPKRRKTEELNKPLGLLGTSTINPALESLCEGSYYCFFGELDPSRYLYLDPSQSYSTTILQQDFDSLVDFVENISFSDSLKILEDSICWDILGEEQHTPVDLYLLTKRVFTEISKLQYTQWSIYMNNVLGFDGIINPTASPILSFKPYEVLSFDIDYIDMIEVFAPSDLEIYQQIQEWL